MPCAACGMPWAATPGIRSNPRVNSLLDALIEAGYVEAWGHSDTGSFWAITTAGHERLEVLGRDA
jgi:radical SAM superfamily enzyme YgiQ (UPF0313 family)